MNFEPIEIEIFSRLIVVSLACVKLMSNANPRLALIKFGTEQLYKLLDSFRNRYIILQSDCSKQYNISRNHIV